MRRKILDLHLAAALGILAPGDKIPKWVRSNGYPLTWLVGNAMLGREVAAHRGFSAGKNIAPPAATADCIRNRLRVVCVKAAPV